MLGEILTHLPAAHASTASFSSDSFGTVGTSASAQLFVSDLTPAKTAPPTHAESLPLHAQAPPLRPMRSITFKHAGETITVTFTEADVIDPPAVRFADNIPQLNEMWDDDPIHWRGSSPLKIKGVPIPLIFWKQVYQSKGRPWRQGNWKGIKGLWFNWKVSTKLRTALAINELFLPVGDYATLA